MEKLTWFKFVISDWMMGKIQKCPEVTQARFMRLCCLYWNKECILSIEDAEIEIDEEHLSILVSKKIILKEGDLIIIKFLNEQNDGVSSLSDKRSAAANARWERNRILKELSMQDNAIASDNNTNAMQNDAEKNREDEIRLEKRTIDKIKPNNIDLRKKDFSATLTPFLDLYGRELLNDFYSYWTEPNKSNTKFKRELEKTWDLKRRLETWAKNDKNFMKNGNPSKMQKLQSAYNTPNPYLNQNEQ